MFYFKAIFYIVWRCFIFVLKHTVSIYFLKLIGIYCQISTISEENVFYLFFRFDFSGKTELPMFNHSQTKISASAAGRCDAVFVWWDLQMDLHNEVILSCAPRWAHPTPTDMQVSKIKLCYGRNN